MPSLLLHITTHNPVVRTYLIGQAVLASTAAKMAAAAAFDQLEEAINKAQEAVQQQGDIVRSLKANLKDGKAQQVHVVAGSCGCVSCCRPQISCTYVTCRVR